MTRTIQRAFTGGALGPDASARGDLAKYESSVRVALNAMVLSQGGAINRSGFQFLCADISNADFGSRDIPFEADTGDSYILEFSHLKMRIIRSDGLVLYPVGHPLAGQVVVIDTPYAVTALEGLKFTQSNDVMTLNHPSYRQRDLTRHDHHDWTFEEVTYVPAAQPPTAVTVVADTPHNSPNDGYSPHIYKYRVAAVINGEEGTPSPVASADIVTDLALQGNKCTVTWGAPATGETPTEYNVYRERNDSGFFGYVGVSLHPTNKFVDENVSPDTTRSFQKVAASFNTTGKYASVAEYHQQRRILANSNNQHQTFWGTRVGQYRSMTAASPAQEDDAFEFTLTNRKRQNIQHIISLGDFLVLMTRTSEWTVKGRSSSVISAASPPIAQINTNYGSADITPLLVGDEILFIEASGQVVRTLGYSFERNSLAGEDLTVLANHFFADRKITSWAWAPVPYRMAWVTFDDGKMCALTYMREQQIWAWTEIVTDGFVERVTAASLSDGSSGVYITVRRRIIGTWRRYKELLHARRISESAEAFHVDSGLTYEDARAIGSISTVAIGLPAHPFVVGDEVEVDMLVYDANSDTPNEARRIYGRYEVYQRTAGTIRVMEDAGAQMDLTGWRLISGVVRRGATVIGGLDHLEGRKIVALADGNVVGTDVDGMVDGSLTVTGGSVTLPARSFRVHVGLPFLFEIETLDLEGGPNVIQALEKTLIDVTMTVDQTRGLWVGADRGTMYETEERTIENYDEATRLQSGKLLWPVSDIWRKDGNFIVQQRNPLPAKILSIMPQFDFGQ